MKDGEIRITKQNLALTQLGSAAELYMAGDFISSITLSAAAEEILGKIMKKNKGTNWLKGEVLFLGSVYEYCGKQAPSEKMLINIINKIKNNLKHNDAGENDVISDDFENEAALLFVRAVKNYYGAFDQMPKDASIINLFDELT